MMAEMRETIVLAEKKMRKKMRNLLQSSVKTMANVMVRRIGLGCSVKSLPKFVMKVEVKVEMRNLLLFLSSFQRVFEEPPLLAAR